MKKLILSFLRYLIKRSAKKRTFDDINKELSFSHDTIVKQIESAKDNKKNHEIIKHIISIEAWSANRLKMFRGKAFIMDDSFHYKPKATSIKDLTKHFSDARQKTIAIAQLVEKEITTGKTVNHNDLGPLTAMQWLYYLTSHAKRDAKRLKVHKK